MDDGKMQINIINQQQRVKDLKRVHDTTKKQRKEKRRGEDDREFKEFLEESEKEAEDGFNDLAQVEIISPRPRSAMLNILGAHAGPPINIEPLEEESGDSPAPEKTQDEGE